MFRLPLILLLVGSAYSPAASQHLPVVPSTVQLSRSLPPAQHAISEAQPRSRRVLIGATVGAVGGGVLGFLAGSSIVVGCKAVYPSDCNPGREERRLRINGALVGAALGAGIGALVGRLWH